LGRLLKIKLLSITGQVIYEDNISQFKKTYHKKIDLSNYAKGIYTLRIISNEGAINNNIIIE